MTQKPLSRWNVIVTTSNNDHFQIDFQSLKRLDLQVAHRFSSALAALDYIAYNTTDLVITDIELNDMDVHAFIAEVNALVRLDAAPVVVFSAQSSSDFVLDAIAAGCSGFVIRPYSLETLRSHLQTIVQLEQLSEIEDNLLAEADLVQRRGVQAGPRELETGQRGRERRRVDRAFQPLPKIGQRTQVILMGVGQHNADQPVAARHDEGRIGHHHIVLGKGIVAEGDPDIDDQPGTIVAVQGQVHADLAGAAQGQEQHLIGGGDASHRIRRNHRVSVSSVA